MAATLAAVACGVGAPPRADAPPFRVVDLMPAYRAFRSAAAGKAVAEQVRLFRAEVIGREPRFFNQVIGPVEDERIRRYLTASEPLDSTIRLKGDEMLAALPTSWARVRQLFPDLAPGARIFLTPTLFSSSGQVRYLDDSLVVMLGPDVQAYVEVVIDSGRRTPPEIGIEHELAHYHHWRRNPEVGGAAKSFFRPGAYAPLYYNLWSEGVATWAARRLNPNVSLATVLGPGLDPGRDAALVPGLAKEFLDKLDSTAEDDVRDLFYLSGKRPDIPARSAYYIGLLVVERIAATRSVAELVGLSGPPLREAIAEALTTLAREPAPR